LLFACFCLLDRPLVDGCDDWLVGDVCAVELVCVCVVLFEDKRVFFSPRFQFPALLGCWFTYGVPCVVPVVCVCSLFG
jgi:hypothetical protein